MTSVFQVAVPFDVSQSAMLTEDTLRALSKNWRDLSLSVLGTCVASLDGRELTDFDGLLCHETIVDPERFALCSDLAVVVRLGTGIDDVNVDSYTAAGVILAATPDGGYRPMASSALTFLLALAHRLSAKEALARSGRWEEARKLVGIGLGGRTLGIIGLGRIGCELARLVRPFQMDIVATDPHPSCPPGDESDIRLVEFAALLQQADFVCVTCPLTTATYHLIDDRALRTMKPSAFLINVARGAIVHHSALVDALASHWIAGAALDVFEQEPLDTRDPLLGFDNVIITPHSIGTTDEWALANVQSACKAFSDVARGQAPQFVVNPDVLRDTRVTARLRGYARNRTAHGHS